VKFVGTAVSILVKQYVWRITIITHVISCTLG
jgi:hypothetical protein